jgi:hypothetical protein
MYRRPRPPAIRRAQVRRARQRTAQVTADGNLVAHFYSQEMQAAWAKIRALDDDLATWRGKAQWAAQQNRAWLAHARSAWRLSPVEVATLIGEARDDTG